MGSFVLAELTRRQIRVRAILRRAGAVPSSDLVQTIVADIYDHAALAAALRGVETVISAFNPGWNEPDLYDSYVRGAAAIQQAARDARVRRLLVIGGASSLFDETGRKLIEKGLPPEPYGSGVRAASDYLDVIAREDRLDWVFLSPPADCGPMGPSGRTGRYRVGTDRPVVDVDGRNALSREDLAVAVVDEIVEPRHHRERYTVGY